MSGEETTKDLLEEEALLQALKTAREANVFTSNTRGVSSPDDNTSKKDEVAEKVIDYELEKLKRKIQKHTGVSREELTIIEKRLQDDKSLHREIPTAFFGTASTIDYSKAILPNITRGLVMREQKERIYTQANTAMTNMVESVEELCLKEIARVNIEGTKNKDDISAIRSMYRLLLTLKELQTGKIHLYRDTAMEADIKGKSVVHGKTGLDEVYVFTAGPLEIEGETVDTLRFTIHPKKFFHPKMSSKGKTTFETHPPALSVECVSSDLPIGCVNLLIENVGNKQNTVVSEVAIGRKQDNKNQEKHLPKKRQYFGKREGSMDANGLQLWQIYEGIAAGLEDFTRDVNIVQSKDQVSLDVLQELERELREYTGLGEDGIRNKSIGFFGNNADTMNVDRAIKQEDMHTEKAEHIRKGVDSIMTNLAHTLGDIGIYSIDTYKEDPNQNEDFLRVAETITRLSLALRETAAGAIVFKRNRDKEEKYTRESSEGGKYPEDTVYAYTAGPFTLRVKEFTSVDFIIRPHDYKRYIVTRTGGILEESRQARTNIVVHSPDLPDGIASIRIDPPDRHSNHITFDIEMGKNNKSNRTLIDMLNLSAVGQEVGHHWRSDYTEENLGLQVWQLHEAIAARLDALTIKSDENQEESIKEDTPSIPEEIAA